jgi:hypothetical protein
MMSGTISPPELARQIADIVDLYLRPDCIGISIGVDPLVGLAYLCLDAQEESLSAEEATRRCGLYDLDIRSEALKWKDAHANDWFFPE